MSKDKSTNYTSIPSNFPKSNDWTAVDKSKLGGDNAQLSISTRKISEINATQLEFEKIIGKGSFGLVWKGKWRLTQVAIKQVKQEIIDEKSTQNMKILNFRF